MKIVVIGGTGLIGSKTVAILRQDGHEVVAASPAAGVNTITGEGLGEALAGAQVVVDVANSPSFEDKACLEFFETSGRNLLAAEATAGVGHHLALSVVGTERVFDSGYLRAKIAQENLIKASGIPYTVLRSTEFFEFLKSIIEAGTDGDVIRLSPALLQPIASDDVAATLADLAVRPALNATVEVAGPEACPLDKFARKFLVARGDRPEVIADIHARYYGNSAGLAFAIASWAPRIRNVSVGRPLRSEQGPPREHQSSTNRTGRGPMAIQAAIPRRPSRRWRMESSLRPPPRARARYCRAPFRTLRAGLRYLHCIPLMRTSICAAPCMIG